MKAPTTLPEHYGMFVYLSSLTQYKQDLIEKVYKDKQIRASCEKFKDKKEDVLHEVVIILSKKTDEELKTIVSNGSIIGYCQRIIKHQFTNPREVMATYSERCAVELPEEMETPEETIEYLKTFDNIMEYVEDEAKKNNKSFYAPRLFLEYANEGSLRKLSASTGIPAKSIHGTLTKYISFLRKKYNI